MRSVVFTERLARAVAELGRLDNVSMADALHRVTRIATRGIPGCAGATVTLWRPGEAVESAVSHPDLGAFLELQHRMRDGPTQEAQRNGKAVFVEETMAEKRWPYLTTAVVRYGVRSMIVIPLQTDAAVTFALYAVRPRVFDEPSVGAVARLLAQQLAVALGNAEAYDDMACEAHQMRQTLASRWHIEQAKGIIMHARGIGSEAAFAELRRISQRTQTKLSDVARKLVHNYPRSPNE